MSSLSGLLFSYRTIAWFNKIEEKSFLTKLVNKYQSILIKQLLIYLFIYVDQKGFVNLLYPLCIGSCIFRLPPLRHRRNWLVCWSFRTRRMAWISPIKLLSCSLTQSEIGEICSTRKIHYVLLHYTGYMHHFSCHWGHRLVEHNKDTGKVRHSQCWN